MILHKLSLLAFLLVLHRGLTLPVRDVSDPSMPLQLIVTPALVNRYTAKKMSLRCEHNPSAPSKLVEIFVMRILKLSTSGWDLVAEQQKLLTSPTVTRNVTASANIGGDISEVFLQVTWDTIGPDCFGVFKCNVVGFDSDGDAVTEKSSTIEVQEFKNFIHHLIGLSMDTQEKMIDMENFTDTEISRLNSGLQRLSKFVKTNHSALDSRLENLEHRITQKELSMDTEMSQMQTEIKDNNVSVASLKTEIITIKNDKIRTIESGQLSTETRVAELETLLRSFHWPSGHYALLKPKTGCPIDLLPHHGTETYLKLHTQSQSSSDPSNSHSPAFPRDTKSTSGSNNFVTLQFCEVTKQIQSNTIRWPQGSFCINKLQSKSCPGGFTDGHVHFDTEDAGDYSEGTQTVANSNSNPYLYFCCQDSGSANTPIQLPTQSPFFLYRYGGVCQAVQGMSVSSEYIQINTEDSGNYDKLSNIHPDVYQPGSSVIKLKLCHYT
ncbi:apextrin-like protein 1 [Elysia marginata]|uniref:Apextrin-like protein 1 n=1 Tax=Elysia marginata TaxID=1093978 RepID=A0AAV4GII5_9GAST|nr:apextrin-like protein 1 [Elysia marginata]